MKNFSTKFFSVVMALAVLGCASSSGKSGGYKAGTYQGNASGFNGFQVEDQT